VAIGVSGETAQTINFTAPLTPASVAGGPYTLQATASSGLPVTFSIVSGPGSIRGNQLSVTGVGTIIIAANQAGNATYAAAPTVEKSVVAELLPIIDLFSHGKLAEGTLSSAQGITLTFTASSTLGDLTTTTLGAPGNDFTIIGGGSCQIGAQYTSGQSCTVEVTFTPSGPGVIVGQLIATDPSGKTQATANLASVRYR